MWLSGVESILGNSAGAMAGGGAKKILLHTTEGSSIDGAVAAYQANNSWPTLTVDCVRRRVVEHLDLTVAARSLRNLSGGVETNRQGSILVQIEIVGFAQNPATIGSTADLSWFAQKVIAQIVDLTGVPLSSTVTWVAYPASYGQTASQRLSANAWSAYSGLLGHQHAPENDHGDPGLIDINTILTAAQPQVPTIDEDDMYMMFSPGKTPRLVSAAHAIQITNTADQQQYIARFGRVDVTNACYDEVMKGTGLPIPVNPGT